MEVSTQSTSTLYPNPTAPQTISPPISWRRRLHPTLPSISQIRHTFFSLPELPKHKRVYVNVNHIPLSSPFSENDDATPAKKNKNSFAGAHEGRIVSNKIVTTQYTILTFIPKNLFHQFRRVANFFFLMIVILQCIPPFQSLEPAVSALPLMIIVGLTAIRDGIEDWKRHETDVVINNRQTLALHNWKNVTIENKLEHHHHRRHRSKYAQSTPTTQGKRSLVSEQAVRLARRVREVLRWVVFYGRRGFRRTRRRVVRTWRTLRCTNAIEDQEENKDEAAFVYAAQEPPIIGYNYRYSEDGESGELYKLNKEPPTNDLSQPYWRPRLWQDVQEGDLLLLRKDDFIPADLLLISSSEATPICYVETMNLDGETNMKIRQCVPGLFPFRSPEELSKKTFWVESEGPTNDLHTYHGAVVLPGTSEEPSEPLASTRVGIELNHLLLRGCALRNTDWVVGMVLFTGADTKLQMNAGVAPSKRSDIERKMNWQIGINLVILFMICIFFALMSRSWEDHYLSIGAPFMTGDPNSSFNSPTYASFVSFMMSIITFQNLVPVALYLTVEGVKTIQAYFIYRDAELFYDEKNIPCKARSWNLSDDLGQIEYIFSDKTGTLTQNKMEFKKCSIQRYMLDFSTTATSPTTTTTIDDQTQIPLIKMDHHKNGVYVVREKAGWQPPTQPRGQEPLEIEVLTDDETEEILSRPRRRQSSHNTLVATEGLGIACQGSIEVKGVDSESNSDADSVSAQGSRTRMSSNATAVSLNPAPSIQRNNARNGREDRSESRNERTVPARSGFSLDGEPFFPEGSSSEAESYARARDYFFLNLGVCHTVLISEAASANIKANTQDGSTATSTPETQSSSWTNSGGSKTTGSDTFYDIPESANYQAQSPDEQALVIASKAMGYIFLRREMDVVFLKHPQEVEPRQYKILSVLEFNSTRKRMSVVVKRLSSTTSPGKDAHENNNHNADEILLLTKGADTVIFRRLAPRQDQLVEDTVSHLNAFARDGLRTLCLAYRPLDPEMYRQWSERHHYASTFVSGGSSGNESHAIIDLARTPNNEDGEIEMQEISDSSEIRPSKPESRDIRYSFKGTTRLEMLEELQDELERDLILLGATGIEDRLQDGVPETIRLLKRAGIKIWMLTGDKLETAISIGVSTGLLSHDHVNNRIDLAGLGHDGSQVSLISKSGVHDSGSVKGNEKKQPDFELLTIEGESESTGSDHPPAEGSQEETDRNAVSTLRIKRGIQRALASFEQPSLGANTLDRDNVDQGGDQSTDPSIQAEGSAGLGDYLPWKIYDRFDSASFIKPFRRSISLTKPTPPQPRDGRNTALVIDGTALKHALDDPECKALLLELACQCSAVVCCRVSPLQKARVVKMVKESKKVMTLSIGDGANDVSMIQEAHIGIGVAGEEGMQAVMASDYSIGQFRFLARLLLVHGHYSYLRNTSMVMLFIFKNIIGIGVLFCYEFVCGYSSIPAFEYSFVLLYNVILTVCPPLIIGIFDRDLGPEVLMTFPELYKVGLLQQEFTTTRFIIYSLEGVLQSIICFVIPYFSYQYGIVDGTGRVQEMYEMGLAMAVASIAQANIFAAVVSQSHCAFHWVFIWGSIALVFVYSVVYACFPNALSQINPDYGFQEIAFGSATFWAVVVLTIVACNIPRLTARYMRRMWFPKDLDIIQEVCKMDHASQSALMGGHPIAPPIKGAPGVTDNSTTAILETHGDRVRVGGGQDQSIYRSLGRHVRLDWIWGFMPASAPCHLKPAAVSIAPSSCTNSTHASLVDPPNLLGRDWLGTGFSPRMVQVNIPPSPALNNVQPVPSEMHLHPSESAPGAAARPPTGPKVPFGLRKGHPLENQLEEDDHEEDETIRENTPRGSKSRSPTFIANSPPSQIGISDLLSSKPPTPILGFGFAQEEGMADIILGMRHHLVRNVSSSSNFSSSSGAKRTVKRAAHQRHGRHSSDGHPQRIQQQDEQKRQKQPTQPIQALRPQPSSSGLTNDLEAPVNPRAANELAPGVIQEEGEEYESAQQGRAMEEAPKVTPTETGLGNESALPFEPLRLWHTNPDS